MNQRKRYMPMPRTRLAAVRTPPSLRIVTWNCRGKFREKYVYLSELRPDVAIIQECERTEKWPDIGATDIVRHNDHPNKDVAVITFGDWNIETQLDPPSDLRHFLPVRIVGCYSFNLLAMWAMKTCAANLSYVDQIEEAVRRFEPWLSDGPSIACGDWNSNGAWDKPHQGDTPFENAVSTLSRAGLVSAYHHHYREDFGDEWRYTYRSNKGNLFHIDYGFIPHEWIGNLKHVQIGRRKWFNWSDHKPLIIDLHF